MFDGVMPDPSVLAERVVQQVVDQLARDGFLDGPDGLAGAAPDDLIASAVSGWVCKLLAPDEPTATATAASDASVSGLGSPPSTPDHPARHHLLAARNSELAAALGACDCWGDEPRCRFCDGEGTPGWLPPDRRLFARYVAPVLCAFPPDPPAAGSADITRDVGTTGPPTTTDDGPSGRRQAHDPAPTDEPDEEDGDG